MKIKNRSNSMALCKFLGMMLAIACFVFGFGSVVRAEVITSVSGAAVSESRKMKRQPSCEGGLSFS